MLPRSLAIVGVGLIGGSVGLAVRRQSPATHIVGVDRDAGALGRALERGAIVEGFTNLADAVACCEFVLFCTPVDTIAQQILAAAPACKPGTTLTDAGSTKGAIVGALNGRLPSGIGFVGGHPLAGSEKQGPEHAEAGLFVDRVVVLTPVAETDRGALNLVTSFWQALGANVRQLSPEAHDRALAVTSHLPHLLASALAGILPAELASLTASGFRDTTRIASGDPALWTAILSANRSELLEVLGKLEERLGEFRRALEKQDLENVRNLLSAGRTSRMSLQRNP
jgi:prephenate dehydrogenase